MAVKSFINCSKNS